MSTVFCVVTRMRKVPQMTLNTKAVTTRRATHDVLPTSWDWRSIDEQAASLYMKQTGRALAVGEYTSAVIDQHRSKWCGCCYLLATVQSVQDRVHIALGKRHANVAARPIVIFDAQLALDAYNHYHKSEDAAWNACHGGSALDVMQGVLEGKIPLVRTVRDTWMGYPQPYTTDKKRPTEVTLTGCERISTASYPLLRTPF